ncbi:MAG: glycosyltransferase, partial [Gemmatimonadaceae bacterium]|nr:glycosyltransferase [Gemmatimonadaceae bacterium]
VPPPWVADDLADGDGAHRALDASRSPTILFLSRLHPIKGLETLLDAWPAVRATRPAARLVIAGAGEPGYERALKARAAQRATDGSVQFTGFVTGSEKARLLANADVFVLPSYHENFGVAVLEAIAAGLPAVVSPEVQLSGVVEENRLGAVVPRDARALASGIIGVLADAPLRERCASQGAAIARSLFTLDSVGAKLRDMYDLARARSGT